MVSFSVFCLITTSLTKNATIVFKLSWQYGEAHALCYSYGCHIASSLFKNIGIGAGHVRPHSVLEIYHNG